MGPESPFSLRSRRRRARIATLAIGVVLLFLGGSFFRTQVVRANDFVLRAEDNRLRAIPIPAPRGPIYDRYGKLIAETVTSYSLHLQPTPPDSARATLEAIRDEMGFTDEQIDGFIDQLRARPFQEITLSRDLDFERVAWIEEHRMEHPTLILQPYPRRRYPQGEAVAHLVGYVGEISRAELEDSVTWAGYRMGDIIGVAGVERYHERILGGRAGERYEEVDARGRVVGEIAPRATVPPIPGEALHLSIDVELQRFIHRIFPREYDGAVVAIEPRTGEVLALYSHPTYDPNLLTGRIDNEPWVRINSDPRRPMLNRASAGRYPPGSTWKLATAIIGLESGTITPQTVMPIACNGGMSYQGRYARCWRPEGHGLQDLTDAIANSCNVYFYQLGISVGLNRLMRDGTRLGFARRTGIDLPGENASSFPGSVDSYRERFGSPPTDNEVMSLAIGQGPNSQTPLRMAHFFAALAADGTAPPPRVRRADIDLRAVETDLEIRPTTLDALWQGMAAVMEEGGTAYMSSLERWKVYGKTGTAENGTDRSHAWFAGFAGAPDGAPEIAFAVIIEHGESGSGMAAPLATKVADFYLNSKYGLPTPPLQTLRERLTRIPYTSGD